MASEGADFLQSEETGNSPIRGAAILLIVGEPQRDEHRDLILAEITKGFRCWDQELTGIDLNEELAAIANKADLGEEGPDGERVIRHQSTKLAVEILINPQTQTVRKSLKVFFSTPTKHRSLIYAGLVFIGDGAWILHDDTFTFKNFVHTFKDCDVENALKQQQEGTLYVHCLPHGEWTDKNVSKHEFSKHLTVKVNPDEVVESLHGALQFTAYLHNFIKYKPVTEILQESEIMGNIRFTRPTLYIFPGCQGDSSLFGISGFNLLINGGYSRKACFWDFTRNLDRIDAMLLTHLGTDNLFGVSSVFERKSIENVHPEIGFMYCNGVDGVKQSSDGENKSDDNLAVNLARKGSSVVKYAIEIGQQPHPCFRSLGGQQAEPVNLYHKVGHGSLDMYILNPIQDSKEMKDFYQQWNQQVSQFGSQLSVPLPNALSICALLVWRPANPQEKITRIFFPGNAPQYKVIEGLERVKHLDFMKHAMCCEKDLKSKPASNTKKLPLGSSKSTTTATRTARATISPVKTDPPRKLEVKKTERPKPMTTTRTNKVQKEDTNKKTSKEKVDKPKSIASTPSKSSSKSSSPSKETTPVRSPIKASTPIKQAESRKEKPKSPKEVPKPSDVIEPLVDLSTQEESPLVPDVNHVDEPLVEEKIAAVASEPIHNEPPQLEPVQPEPIQKPSSPAPLPDPDEFEKEAEVQPAVDMMKPGGFDKQQLAEMGIYDEETVENEFPNHTEENGIDDPQEIQPQALPDPVVPANVFSVEPDVISDVAPLKEASPELEPVEPSEVVMKEPDIIPSTQLDDEEESGMFESKTAEPSLHEPDLVQTDEKPDEPTVESDHDVQTDDYKVQEQLPDEPVHDITPDVSKASMFADNDIAATSDPTDVAQKPAVLEDHPDNDINKESSFHDDDKLETKVDDNSSFEEIIPEKEIVTHGAQLEQVEEAKIGQECYFDDEQDQGHFDKELSQEKLTENASSKTTDVEEHRVLKDVVPDVKEVDENKVDPIEHSSDEKLVLHTEDKHEFTDSDSDGSQEIVLTSDLTEPHKVEDKPVPYQEPEAEKDMAATGSVLKETEQKHELTSEIDQVQDIQSEKERIDVQNIEQPQLSSAETNEQYELEKQPEEQDRLQEPELRPEMEHELEDREFSQELDHEHDLDGQAISQNIEQHHDMKEQVLDQDIEPKHEFQEQAFSQDTEQYPDIKEQVLDQDIEPKHEFQEHAFSQDTEQQPDIKEQVLDQDIEPKHEFQEQAFSQDGQQPRLNEVLGEDNEKHHEFQEQAFSQDVEQPDMKEQVLGQGYEKQHEFEDQAISQESQQPFVLKEPALSQDFEELAEQTPSQDKVPQTEFENPGFSQEMEQQSELEKQYELEKQLLKQDMEQQHDLEDIAISQDKYQHEDQAIIHDMKPESELEAQTELQAEMEHGLAHEDVQEDEIKTKSESYEQEQLFDDGMSKDKLMAEDGNVKAAVYSEPEEDEHLTKDSDVEQSTRSSDEVSAELYNQQTVKSDDEDRTRQDLAETESDTQKSPVLEDAPKDDLMDVPIPSSSMEKESEMDAFDKPSSLEKTVDEEKESIVAHENESSNVDLKSEETKIVPDEQAPVCREPHYVYEKDVDMSDEETDDQPREQIEIQYGNKRKDVIMEEQDEEEVDEDDRGKFDREISPDSVDSNSDIDSQEEIVDDDHAQYSPHVKYDSLSKEDHDDLVCVENGDDDQQTLEVSNIPEAFEKDITPNPDDQFCARNNIQTSNRITDITAERFQSDEEDEFDHREDTDSIDGGTPDSDKDIDESFGNAAEAETLKQNKNQTSHPADMHHFDPLDGQAVSTSDKWSMNPFDSAEQQVLNPFHGIEHQTEPHPQASPEKRRVEQFDDSLEAKNQTDQIPSQPAFNPLQDWGEPMGLPAPPPPSASNATEKAETKKTDKKPPSASSKPKVNGIADKPKSSRPPADKKSDSSKSTTASDRLNTSKTARSATSSSTTDRANTSRLNKSTTEKKEPTKSATSRLNVSKTRPATASKTDKPDSRPKSAPTSKRPATGSRASPAAVKTPPLPPHTTFYVDLTYIPNHGNPSYSDIEFFKRIRARYYVLSALSPNPQILNSLLDAKQTWENKEAEVTVIPTYDNDTLRHWMGLHKDQLSELRIDVAPSASRCTIQLQDHETASSAYRLEF